MFYQLILGSVFIISPPQHTGFSGQSPARPAYSRPIHSGLVGLSASKLSSTPCTFGPFSLNLVTSSSSAASTAQPTNKSRTYATIISMPESGQSASAWPFVRGSSFVSLTRKYIYKHGLADADFFQGAVYISSYAHKLRNEKTWRSGPQVVVVPMNNNNTGPKYTHVKQEDESHPHTGTSYAYPYRDGNHSFGNSNTHHQSAV